jgi:hypothetical protein
MSIGDGIAIGMGTWATAALFWSLAWNNVRLSQIRVDAAKSGIKTKAR